MIYARSFAHLLILALGLCVLLLACEDDAPGESSTMDVDGTASTTAMTTVPSATGADTSGPMDVPDATTTSTGVDTTMVSATDATSTTTPDAAGDGSGTTSDLADGSGQNDVSPDMDAGDVDAPEPDMPVVDPRPAGQCTSDSDCPGVDGLQLCTSAPGGICNCGVDAHCPGGETCDFGSCVTDCSADSDCPAGTFCSGATSRCLILGCDPSGNCPDPRFDCRGTQCVRFSCGGVSTCPTGTICVDGSCVVSP